MAIIAVIMMVVPAILYVAGGSSKADAAMAKATDVNERVDRVVVTLRENRDDTKKLLETTAQMKGQLDILVGRKRSLDAE